MIEIKKKIVKLEEEEESFVPSHTLVVDGRNSRTVI